MTTLAADRGLPIRISSFNKREGNNNGEKGLKKMIIAESKKKRPGCDDDFKAVDVKRRRRMGIREDCERALPKKMMIHREKKKENCTAIDHACTTTSLSLTVDAHQLSPTKALRAALMKKRYAHLIFKATHQGDIADHLKQQEEREKARIEEEVKAAQTLLRMRTEAGLKIQREAARIAREKMEKTVEFNDACQIMRDFESLLNAS